MAPRDYGAICPPDLVERGVWWQQQIHAAGYAGIHWPVAFGGRGLTPEHNAVWMLECAVAGRAAVPQHGRARPRRRIDPARSAPPRSRQRHLRSDVAGRAGVVPAVQRARVRAATSQASRRGPSATATTSWSTGRRCGAAAVATATGASSWPAPTRSAPKHQGISFFLCPMDLPGIEVRPLRQMTGEAEFDEVFFTEVRLPAARLLGPLHGGWGVGHGGADQRAGPHRHERDRPRTAARVDGRPVRRTRPRAGRSPTARRPADAGACRSRRWPSGRARWPRRRRR